MESEMAKETNKNFNQEDYILIPESECEDQAEYPTDEQILRDIAGWEQEAQAWEEGEIALRTTILTDDGRRIGPEMMTHAQYQEQLREIEAAPITQLHLLSELLKWAGRPAATPEENAEVEGLRHQAEQILKTAGVC
jgi:hypothetical protein